MGQLTQTTVETQGLLDDVPNKAETAADVGLGNVNNTADLDKPVSTAQQAYSDTKEPINSSITILGSGDISTELNAAIASVSGHTNPVVVIPASATAYNINSISINYNGLTIIADGAHLINNSAALPAFIISSVLNFNLSVGILETEVGAGHSFDVTGLFNESSINVRVLSHKDPDTRIINSDYNINVNTRMYFNNFTGMYWYHPLSTTTPAIVMSGTINSHSSNRFNIARHETNPNAVRPIQPFYEIRCDGASFQYGNSITGGVEKCVGGFVHLYSCYNSIIEDITFYDLTQNGFNINAPLIKMDRGLALRRCENTSLKNILKTAGVTDGGIYDIDNVQGQRTIMQSISAVTGTMDINLAGLSATIINCDDTALSNTARTTIIGDISKNYEFTVATLPAVILGGEIFVTDDAGGATKAWSDGANWLRIRDNVIIS